MSPRRKLVLTALVVVATGLYALWRAPEWTARLIEHALANYFHRPVHVTTVRLQLAPFELHVVGLRVAGLTPGAPPFLEVPLVRIQPSLAPLQGSRIVLSRVRLEGLRLRIHAFPSPPVGPGGDDIPKLGSGRRGGGGVQVSIRRLVIQGGEFILDHDRVPLELELPNFHGRLQSRPQGGIAGHVSFGPGEVRFGNAPVMPMGTEVDVFVHRGLLTVEGARLVGEGTSLAYRGRLSLSGRPRGQFSLEGQVDLAYLDRHVFRSGLGLSGAARWDGLFSVDGSRLRVEGRVEGTGGTFRGVAVPRFASELSYDGSSGLVMRDLDVDALGGTARLDIDVPPTASGREVRIAGSVRDADGEGALRMIFGWGALGVGTAATGDVEVRWPKRGPRRVSGRIVLDLAGRDDGRTPLKGRFEWSGLDGAQNYERVDLRGSDMSAQIAGRVGADNSADLALDAESSDLGATDGLLTRVRRALGNAEAQKAGFTGAGFFRGRWRGTTSVPLFEGRFRGQDVGYAGVQWGRTEWVGRLDTGAEAVESHSLELRKGDAELWWDGRSEIGWYGVRDALSGQARVRDWPVEDIVRFMRWRVKASGLLSGRARVEGRRSAPEGEARITAGSGSWYGVPFEKAAITARWRGRLAEVAAGEVTLGGGRFAFHGSVTDDGVYDGSAELEGVDVGAVVPARGGVALSGRLSGRLVLQGTLARPRLRASVVSPRLFFADEGLGALEATLRGSGDGEIRLESRCRSARVDLTLTGDVAASAPYVAALELAARSTSLDPFLRAVGVPLPATFGVVASGDVLLRGPLAQPAALRAEATLPELRLLVPDYTIGAREPLRFAFADGRLRVEDFDVAGEGTDLVLSGDADLLGEGPLHLSARGRADLRVLSLLTRRVRGSGAARLALSVAGTRSAPSLLGTLDLQGAGLRVRGFPHGIEGVRGQVRFTESAAEIEGVTGTLAGGELAITGQASYAGGHLTSYDIRPVGRRLALRYPEGLRSLLDADLRLFGDARQQWLTGTVNVRQALYTRRYDVASEILGAGRALAPAAPVSTAEGVRLDVLLRAPGTLRIDNNLATLAARAELTLQGTTQAPVVTGRVEIDRGQVYFQGRTYVIRKGTLDFVNPRRIDPLFEIEAETQIRSYRVTLRIGGTLERVTPTLTSDPPLSSLQILALLAGQDESEVANLTQAQARQSQAQLAAAGAATLAAGRLSESVGLEREAERLFGLNRFSIDPSLLRGAGSTPTARVTVGKRLAPGLNVLYSQDLRGTEERILAIEYNLSDRLSLLLTRTDPGTAKSGVERGWAFDVRVRRSR